MRYLILFLFSTSLFASQMLQDLSLKEKSASPTPQAGYGKIYPKTDKLLYYQNSVGVEQNVALGSTDVLGRALTGYSKIGTLPISATDTVLSSIQKLENNIPNKPSMFDPGTSVFKFEDFGVLMRFVLIPKRKFKKWMANRSHYYADSMKLVKVGWFKYYIFKFDLVDLKQTTMFDKYQWLQKDELERIIK